MKSINTVGLFEICEIAAELAHLRPDDVHRKLIRALRDYGVSLPSDAGRHKVMIEAGLVQESLEDLIGDLAEEIPALSDDVWVTMG